MHHGLQFGMRENPASERRHGSRQAVLRSANNNHVNDQGVSVSVLTPARSQPLTNIPGDLDATATQPATGKERLRELSRAQKSKSHLTKRMALLFNVVMRTNGMAHNSALGSWMA